MICKKEDHKTSDHERYTASLKRSKNYKAQSYQYASPSKQILKAKAKAFPRYTHYGFNDYIPNDCRNYLSKFDAKDDDGYLLEYSFVSKAFRVFNTRKQQVEETYHVTFDEKKHVPGVITLNEPDIPHTEDAEGPPDLINTEGTHEQNVQDEQIITQSIEGPSGNNIEVLVSIIEYLVPDVPQSQISNQASTISYHVPQNRCSKDQHIKLVNIIGDPGKGMLTRSMASKLTVSSARECLFDDFLSKIEPKKMFGALKHQVWVDAIQEELNQFYKYKVIVRKKELTMLKPLHQCACLNGKLKEEVYVKQPPRFKSSEFLDYVCKLDKALYGPKQAHMVWCLKGTPTLGLYYLKCSSFDLKGYSDSDYAGCNMDRKSTSGCCASIIWMKSQLSDYDIHYKMVPIFCNNTSAIAISNNPVLHSRTKHIDIREFWCTTISYDPSLPSNDSVACPLKEYLIKFSVMNDQKQLTLDFQTFCSSTGLDYNKRKYVTHPYPEAIKTKLAKVLGENYSSTEQINSIQQMIAYCLITRTEGLEASGAVSKQRQKPKSKKTPTETQVTPPSGPTEGSEQPHPLFSGNVPDPQDPERNIQRNGTRFPSTSLDEGTRKSELFPKSTVKTMPLPKGPLGDKDLEGSKPPANMELITTTVIDLSGTDAEYQVDETQSTRLSDDEDVFEAGEDMDKDTQADEEEHQSPPPNTDKPKPSHAQETQESDSDSSCPELKKYDNILPLTEKQLTDTLVQSTMDCLEKNITERAGLLKALIGGTETLKVVQEVVKDDQALNKKIGGLLIHKDLSKGTKVLDGGSDDLNGGIEVVEVVVKWLAGVICDEVVFENDHLEGVDGNVNSFDLGSFTERIVHSDAGEGVASIKRGRQDFLGDGVRDSATASGHSRLKVDLESSTWRRHHDYKVTLSRDENPIRTLEDYSKPSHEGYRNTIKLPIGNNVDPSPHGRILPLISLLNSFHWEGMQNSATIFAFVEYASSHTDKARRARFSKFEADFKQQQSEMTKKINTVLKAITDRIAGALPSDMVKNPKLNVNSTTLLSFAPSYPTIYPQCSSHPFTSTNAIKTCSEEASHS
nr:hypothetical protein [Tanacetum cinerariifolium]